MLLTKFPRTGTDLIPFAMQAVSFSPQRIGNLRPIPYPDLRVPCPDFRVWFEGTRPFLNQSTIRIYYFEVNMMMHLDFCDPVVKFFLNHPKKFH